MRALLVPLMVVALPGPVMAQGALAWDFSAAVGSGGRRAALSVLRNAAGAGSMLQVALGGRLTWYTGDTVDFALRGDPGGCVPGVIDCIPASLPLAPAVLGINIFAELTVRPVRRIAVGANLDLAGIAAGPDREQGRPARWSLFLYGNRDRGSLTSEFFASVRMSDRVLVRGGLSHFVVGYQRETDAGESARYQRFFDAAFLAVRIGL